MKNLVSILFLLVLVSPFTYMDGQSTIVQGKVIDSNSGTPIPYATVVAHDLISNDLLGGSATDEEGAFNFEVEGRKFYVEVSFIGYQTLKIEEFELMGETLDLGDITLFEDAQQLNEVEITAQKSTVEFKLDKRVFNVGQDLASAGMGALELLNNVPSVNVNIEGDISLRGNTGVQILIDGKPSVISDQGSNALGSLTGDMIESIELITNPSAKYEAEGSAGIINIILKKEEKRGFNGSISANTGVPDNHSLGSSLNLRTEKFNFFTQFGAGYRSLPRFKESIIRDLVDGTEIVTDGTEYRNERFANITLGADYYFNDLNILTLSGSYAYEDEDQPSETDFFIRNGQGDLVTQYQRKESTSAGNPKYQFDVQFERQFKNDENHVLLFSSSGRFFGKEQSSTFTNTLKAGILDEPNQRTETDFFEQDFVYKLDYVNPLNNEYRIEAGAQYETKDVGNDFSVSNQNSSGMYEVVPELTNNFEFDQKVLGVYVTGAYELDKWGVKVGARVENTQLNTILTTTNEVNNQDYTNLFPSVHTSYKVSDRVSVQAGYSRRVSRPRLWDLNPFFNIRNNFNIRRGNPDLLPEFADSYEVTGVLIYEKVSLNASVYHLYTTDVVERVSFFEGNVNVTTPVNVGVRNQTGFELNGKYTPNKWLTLNGDFNYGFFTRNGRFQDQDFDFDGNQRFTTLTSRIKLPWSLEFEMTGEYQSPFNTVQGRQSGYAFADLGVRKKISDGKVVVNLSVRDLFRSRIEENVRTQSGKYLYDYSLRGRYFALGLSYSFGKGEAMSYTGRRR